MKTITTREYIEKTITKQEKQLKNN